MLALFLDESGDHNLKVIDPQYPIFVLGGCIIDFKYHQEVMAPLLSNYKKCLFGGRDDVILHTADIVRRRGIFKKLTEKTFRKKFYEETNQLMKNLEYTVVACIIRKDRHLARYGLAAVDPYMLSLKVLVERFVYEIQEHGENEPGHIIAEARDKTLDNELRLAWMGLRTTGTEYVSASEVKKKIRAIYIRDKKENIAGLQLADLVISPIGRYVLGKALKQDWEIVKSKLRKNARGNHMGFGLVILPKKLKAAPE